MHLSRMPTFGSQSHRVNQRQQQPKKHRKPLPKWCAPHFLHLSFSPQHTRGERDSEKKRVQGKEDTRRKRKEGKEPLPWVPNIGVGGKKMRFKLNVWDWGSSTRFWILEVIGKVVESEQNILKRTRKKYLTGTVEDSVEECEEIFCSCISQAQTSQ